MSLPLPCHSLHSAYRTTLPVLGTGEGNCVIGDIGKMIDKGIVLGLVMWSLAYHVVSFDYGTNGVIPPRAINATIYPQNAQHNKLVI